MRRIETRRANAGLLRCNVCKHATMQANRFGSRGFEACRAGTLYLSRRLRSRLLERTTLFAQVTEPQWLVNAGQKLKLLR